MKERNICKGGKIKIVVVKQNEREIQENKMIVRFFFRLRTSKFVNEVSKNVLSLFFIFLISSELFSKNRL